MANTLLDTVTVTVDAAPGAWSRGPNPVEYPDRVFNRVVTDICEPAYPLPAPPDVALGEDVRPFAIVGYAKVPTRCCSLAELTDALGDLFPRTVEYRAAHYLWHGTGVVADEMCLVNPDVDTVARTGQWAVDLASVLDAAYAKNAHMTPVILLGVESALHLALGLTNLTVPYVVSPAFPTKGIAVVDSDIEITLSTVDTTTATQVHLNRHYWESTQLARVAFDLTKTVRLAD